MAQILSKEETAGGVSAEEVEEEEEEDEEEDDDSDAFNSLSNGFSKERGPGNAEASLECCKIRAVSKSQRIC